MHKTPKWPYNRPYLFIVLFTFDVNVPRFVHFVNKLHSNWNSLCLVSSSIPTSHKSLYNSISSLQGVFVTTLSGASNEKNSQHTCWRNSCSIWCSRRYSRWLGGIIVSLVYYVWRHRHALTYPHTHTVDGGWWTLIFNTFPLRLISVLLYASLLALCIYPLLFCN